MPRLGHRRTDSVTIEGEDYFLSLAKFASGDSKSIPGTPRSITARNISFSPRIQFHDTWPSGEYDRRGEIATCNRLTPMLAQQIKEELNTFKMVFRRVLDGEFTANILKGNGGTRTIQGLHTLLLIQTDQHQFSPMKPQLLPTLFASDAISGISFHPRELLLLGGYCRIFLGCVHYVHSQRVVFS